MSSSSEADVLYEGEPLVGLLTATATGDRQAFAQLYQSTSPKLFAIALRMLRQRDAAEDVLQEAFISIWNTASQFRPERGHPLHWMASIVRYRALDRLRRQSRAPVVLAGASAPIPEVRDLSALAVSDGHSTAIGDCLQQLQASQSDAILLAFYFGMTHDELAVHLDTPLGTIKSWIRRGLVQLKDCLET